MISYLVLLLPLLIWDSLRAEAVLSIFLSVGITPGWAPGIFDLDKFCTGSEFQLALHQVKG